MQDKAEMKELRTDNTVSTRKVRPREDTDIYATKDAKHLGPEGTKHTVHKHLAGTLIAKGYASLTAPKVKAEEVKLTKEQLDALALALGHKPTKEEIATEIVAIKAAEAQKEDL